MCWSLDVVFEEYMYAYMHHVPILRKNIKKNKDMLKTWIFLRGLTWAAASSHRRLWWTWMPVSLLAKR